VYIPYDNHCEFKSLLGKTLVSVTKTGDDDEIHFVTNTGETFVLFHSQDCCENVSIEDITGDLADLVGEPIMVAEEASSETRPDSVPAPSYEPDSQTWTFYKLATIKGYVDIRWFGTSNGYYSESVSFGRLPKGD